MIIFVPKLVQNHYMDENLAKFPIKLKNGQFFLIPFIFQNFRRLRPQKFRVLCPKNPDFWSWGPLQGRESPPQNLLMLPLLRKNGNRLFGRKTVHTLLNSEHAECLIYLHDFLTKIWETDLGNTSKVTVSAM